MSTFFCSIKELDAEVLKGRENYEAINLSVKNLKKTVNEKNDYIDQLHNNIAVANTVCI